MEEYSKQTKVEAGSRGRMLRAKLFRVQIKKQVCGFGVVSFVKQLINSTQ